MVEKYNDNLTKTKDFKENNFLIIAEFNFSKSNSTFKIINPILSYNIRQRINDISCLSRSWRLSKKKEENLIGIGDVIKLGRVRLKIETICFKDIYESSQITNNIIKNKIKFGGISQNNLNINKINNNMNTNINYSQNESIIEEGKLDLEQNKLKKKEKTISENISLNSDKSSTSRPTCRICYLHNSDIENPLVSPCKCSGSMKFIHYKNQIINIIIGRITCVKFVKKNIPNISN